MTEQPKLFVDAICAVFKPANGDPERGDESAERLAVAAYDLLEGLHVLPGQQNDDVNEAKLIAWSAAVRHLGLEADRAKVTDMRIGHLFAHAPPSKLDNAWPHEAVRAAIELFQSDDLERGLTIERFNMRGVFSKSIGEGGNKERALSRKYWNWAEAVAKHPRTAAMLMRISENWARDA